MPGEEIFMSLGVEGRYGVPSVVVLGISSGVPGLVALLVTGNIVHGIFCDVDSVFPGLVYLGSAISVTS